MNIGHNHKSENEKIRDQKFMQALPKYREEQANMARARGEIKDIYKRYSIYDIDKEAFAFAEKLRKDEDGKVRKQLQMMNWVAAIIDPELAQQFEMFGPDSIDRSEVIYSQGYTAGALREENKHEYTGEDAQQWQKGFNDGTEFINAELDAEINGNAEDDDDEEDNVVPIDKDKF